MFRRRRGGEGAPRLVARFALYSGIALVLAAAVALFFLRENATRRAQDAVFADARFAAERLARDDLLREPARGLVLRHPPAPVRPGC